MKIIVCVDAAAGGVVEFDAGAGGKPFYRHMVTRRIGEKVKGER